MHVPEFVQQQQLQRKQTACQSLVQRLTQPRDQQQLERSAYLLVYALRLDSEQTLWQQTLLYPTLLQLLRAGSQQHGHDVITVVLEAVATIARKDVRSCSTLLDLGIVTRLAEALDSGLTSLAARHAVEALHALATHLPTSRDLILATGAVAKLLALLRDSLLQAHYSMLKGIVWTLICLADDDPLCQAAARTAGALPLLVSVMGLASKSPHLDAFMGLSALAARALRLLGDCSSSSSTDQLCCQSPLAKSKSFVSTQPEPQLSTSVAEGEEEEDWVLAAVPLLARMLDAPDRGCYTQPLARSLSSSSQKLRTARSQLAQILGAWVFAQALLDVYGYTEASPASLSSQEPVSTAQADGSSPGDNPKLAVRSPASLSSQEPVSTAQADGRSPGDKPESAVSSPEELSSREPMSTPQAGGGTPGDKTESAPRSPEEDMLVDKGFFAQSSISKETKAAAHEVLVRVLETGPSSLEPVKEAVGALRALASGRAEVTAASADAGVVKMLVMLLHEDYSSRVAFEASELLTLLTDEREEQAGCTADVDTLECMLDLTKTLLQASGALSDAADACLRDTNKETVPAGLASTPSLMTKLSSLKVAPSGGGNTATAAAEKPRISWSTACVEAKPGFPAILTLPNGDCQEVSVPQSPSAGAEAGHGTSAAASNQPTDMASMEVPVQYEHPPSSYPSGATSKDANLSSSFGRSVSSKFGSLLKRLGSINVHSSSSGNAEGMEQPQWQAAAGLPISARSPGAVSPGSSACTVFSAGLPGSHSIRSEAFSAAAKTVNQPRHPSQPILRAVVMATASLLGSNPAGQEALIKLGAVGVIHDVLVLAGSVGLQSGLAKAAAHLVKSISTGNPDAQQAFGDTATIPQLLFLLQASLSPPQPAGDTAAAAADPLDTASTALRLVWALHAVIDGHKANQQALQAAGGLPLITSLLAQASTQPSSETLPVPPSHATPNTPTANPTQPLHTGVHAPSDPARGEDHPAADSQAADQAQLVHALVWLIGSAAAGIPANQLALHQSGAVYLLLHQVQWSKSPAVVTGAMWALASLAKDSADVQSEVQLQGGIQLLVHMLNGDAAQLEAALWALQSGVSHHASNQTAAVQAGALPKLVDLLEMGPDTSVAQYAADCLYWLVQGCLQNQDAACAAGALGPLLDIVAAGPEQLAARSAALAISALAANHTANQDAFRGAEGLLPIVNLLKGGASCPAAVCAAEAIANLVSHNGINQDAVADAGGVEALIELLAAAVHALPGDMQDATQTEFRAAIESTKALSALVDGNLPNQDRAVQAGAPGLLCQMASSTGGSDSHSPAACQLSWQVSKAFCCLADDHPAAQQACASAIPAVVSFLSLPDAAVREQACQALACLTCNCHQNQNIAGQHGAVDLLLHLLWTPCDSQQQQQEVVQLLLALLVVAVQVGKAGATAPSSVACPHAVAFVQCIASACLQFGYGGNRPCINGLLRQNTQDLFCIRTLTSSIEMTVSILNSPSV
ncbi:hypothetical protein ABBQ38_000664 [Trebouxia sp. C0009 RCD-2024]